jgi:hypothetical protein
MNKKQRHPKDAEIRKQIARTVQRRLALLIVIFIVILLALLLKIGEGWWPGWLIEHHRQFEGMIVLAVILLMLLSPIVAEASSNPRALSGPGKNPEGPRLE